MELPFSAYGLMLFLAIHAAVLLTEVRLRPRGQSLVDKPLVLFAALLGGLAGGRVHYVVEQLVRGTMSSGDVLSALSPLRGGSTFYGAMAGLLVALVLMRRHLPFGSVLRTLDAGVPGVAVAIAVGRVGCLLNGCCLGAPTARPWGWRADAGAHPGLGEGGSVFLHPLVLYLGAWSLGAAWLATREAVTARVGARPGQSFLAFGLLFSLGRFVLERFRLGDPTPAAATNWARWESLALAGLALVALWIRRENAASGPNVKR